MDRKQKTQGNTFGAPSGTSRSGRKNLLPPDLLTAIHNLGIVRNVDVAAQQSTTGSSNVKPTYKPDPIVEPSVDMNSFFEPMQHTRGTFKNINNQGRDRGNTNQHSERSWRPRSPDPIVESSADMSSVFEPTQHTRGTFKNINNRWRNRGNTNQHSESSWRSRSPDRIVESSADMSSFFEPAQHTRGTFKNVNNRGRGRGNTNQHSESSWRSRSPDPIVESSADMSSFFEPAQHTRGAFKSNNNRGRGRGNTNQHSERPRRPTYAMGFKKLQELVEENEPEEFVLKLSSCLEPFTLLLEEDVSNDLVVLIMTAMAKLSEASFEQKKIQILHLTCKEKFKERLARLIMDVAIHEREDKLRSRYFWQNPDSFFRNLHKYCEMLLKSIPSTALGILPKLLKAVTYTILHLENISDHIGIIFGDVELKLTHCQEEMQRKKAKGEKLDVDDMEPPENFREISLFPLPYEITTYNKPFLRENIVEGAYRNVEHYLDVQFRLVREDFVKPLRDGVSRYMNRQNGDGKKVQTIKLYHKVRFLKPELCSNAINGYLIQMPTAGGKKLNLKLENSRMFMYGTLVCFTKDNFTEIAFGRIVDRKIELLREGKLIVALESMGDTVDYNADYLMVECKVFFEPYYYVLKALQQIEEATFPMANYIVTMDPNPLLPNYLVQNVETVGNVESDEEDLLIRDMYGLSIRDKYRLSIRDKYRIPVEDGILNPNQWPSAETLEVNEAQYAAYKNALSQQFAIIQGPPGTGKTYLGLKVAEALLANKERWHGEPMLVICYTNHALDQFLEGILKFTKNIVRIGGQSKNQNVNQYNLKAARNHRYSRLIFDEYNRVKRQAHTMQTLYDMLEATKTFNGVVDLSQMLVELPEAAGTWLGNVNGIKLKRWLFGGVNLMGQRRTIDDVINQGITKPVLREDSAQNLDVENEDDFKAAAQALGTGEEHKTDEDDISFGYIHGNFYVSSFESLQRQMDSIKQEAQDMENCAAENPNYKFNEAKFEDLRMQYWILAEEFDYLQMRMAEGTNLAGIHRNINVDIENPDYIHPDDRWMLYFQWLDQYRGYILQKIEMVEDKYRDLYRAYEEVKEIADIEMLRSTAVVGMTTTSAARLQATLRALRSRIVIVEEAAEIMEAHIVTALTKNCEHLILIGDHQQLRPSTADYVMETKYNLGISLFERMIRNKVHCNVLEIQHRMRPEISKLIVPTIYPNLVDHESTHAFPNIRGVDRNLYFIDHQQSENTEKDESKFNMHEVQYLLALAQYLLQNGYEPSEITILCAYSAQLFKMFKERRNYPLLEHVRICVLDNYQGEECKIILLSLVRNNDNNSIGFLKIENRVCVALSRAREGFYMMGNMTMLSSNAEIWRHIKKTLTDQDSLGPALPVRCQIHQSTVTLLENVDDFYKVAEGGCDQPCNQLLTCGHRCTTQCHILNREHKDYTCKENCKKVLCDEDHVCPKKCYEECGPCLFQMLRTLPCGHSEFFPCHQTSFTCLVRVKSDLPCGHSVENKPCHVLPEDFRCPFPCETRVEKCGHACVLNCHIRDDPDHLTYKCWKECDRVRPECQNEDNERHRCQKPCYVDCDKCNIVVKKLKSCSHMYDLQCCVNVEEVACRKPCKRKMDCGHMCKLDCMEECGNCLVKVQKKIEECGHTMTVLCKDKPTKKNCNGPCPMMLSCGHQCQNKCRDECTKQCKVQVDSIIALSCQHLAKIPCYLNVASEIENNNKLLEYCKEPCTKELKCGHRCSGNCGDCYQGRIHKVCMSNCGVTLVCGHVCKTPCREVCPPCTEKCIYRCSHSKCNKRCGEPCTNCKESCQRRCRHQRCQKLCHQPCSVPPCEASCEKKLRCGHHCVGYCGDPCPPLCRICDNKELTEIFFGNEDEEFARFVLLEDCKHVFESGGLETWLRGNNGEIGVKACPRCKTAILNTKRYSDYVKLTVKNVTDVKQKFYGSLNDNIASGKRSQQKLELLIKRTGLHKECPALKFLGGILGQRLQPVKLSRNQKKRQMVSKAIVQIVHAKIQVLENICDLYDDVIKNSRFVLTKACKDYINFLITRLALDPERMTEQEIEDFEVEIKRLRRMLRLDHLESSNDENVKMELEGLSKTIGGLDVSECELKEIVKVIGVRSGAWYKCPNGHPYAIGECGMAMVMSNCADCGAQIGGRDHTLIGTNTRFSLEGSR